jgi:hypothetical protein
LTMIPKKLSITPLLFKNYSGILSPQHPFFMDRQ